MHLIGDASLPLSGCNPTMNMHMSNDRQSVRVLVVDDYAAVANHLARVLCDNDYTAIPVFSGEEALRVAEEFSPHALIADVMMPGMNGVDLVYAFADKFPTCRAVMMTANQWLPEIFIGGLRIKVFQKPFDLEELFEFLASAAPEPNRFASQS
jgi:two-component system, OmpR family, response regulator